jgi:branched-chain amino acid transport system permease protein
MINGRKLLKPLIYLAVLVFLFAIPLFVQGNYLLHIFIMCGISVLLASSFRLISTTGQMSLGHAGFMAIGSYTTALLVMKSGFPFWEALPLGGVAAALIALLVGYPFVRVRKVYFAMLTLFLGQVIRLTIAEWRGMTGGTSGLLGIPSPNSIDFFGLYNMVFNTKVIYYYLILVIVLISLLILYRISSSRVGRTLMAIQQGDYVAASIGIGVNNYKVFAWCVGCFFAGIAGGFYAHYIKVLTPDSFGVIQAIYVMVYAVVGGRSKFLGAVIGAILLTALPEFLRPLKEYQPLVFVGILFIIIFLLPGGLVDLPKLVTSRIRELRRSKVDYA